MNILSFEEVMHVFRRNISDAFWPGQPAFFRSLFWDFLEAKPKAGFDDGLISNRMNGKEPLSKEFVQHYSKNGNQETLKNTIVKEVMPKLDSARVVEELKLLLLCAENVSKRKKLELLDGYTFEDTTDEAVFITEVLCLAIQLPKCCQLTIQKNRSPSVTGYLFGTECPPPCRHFVGRENELNHLHEELLDHKKVFLRGIPGIGKSEMAKKYVKCFGKKYTNVIYLSYQGMLKRMISRMDFADDRIGEDEEARFSNHSSFLRSLHEDNLLIIDNFNVTETEDPFLDELLTYPCRILFTSRCRYEEQRTMDLSEMSQAELRLLMEKLFEKAGEKPKLICDIIELLHKHTFAVELAARLMRRGILNPRALRRKLKKEKAAMDATDKIRAAKDGKYRKATYYDHIHSLFSLYDLLPEEQEILRSLTMIPEEGIDAQTFAEWMQQTDMNILNDLLDMGFIHMKNDTEILLHPMIREVALEELKPSTQNCAVLLDSLQQISRMYGWEYINNKQLFHTVESIIATIHKDDIAQYLLFLQNVFEYMDKYRYESGMQTVIEEMTAILTDGSVGTSADRACLLDARVALEKDTLKQLALEEEAIQVLGSVHPGNAHLAANLHANLGALYYKSGRVDLAEVNMERGMRLLEEYNLTHYHDSVIQICNYAVLLTDMGESRKAYSALLKLASRVKECNSDECLDYGLIQENMGNVCLVMRDLPLAQMHYEKAMDIFELVFEDEPELLEEKRQDFRRVARLFRQQGQNRLE